MGCEGALRKPASVPKYETIGPLGPRACGGVRRCFDSCTTTLASWISKGSSLLYVWTGRLGQAGPVLELELITRKWLEQINMVLDSCLLAKRRFESRAARLGIIQGFFVLYGRMTFSKPRAHQLLLTQSPKKMIIVSIAP